MEDRIVIIGGGPTGLGAAYRLQEVGYRNFQLFERTEHLGGLAGSVTDKAGFTWDIGGHVMFSHYEYYDRVFNRLMGDEYQLNMRESWVRMFDTWVPYPFQNNIRYLPRQVAFECLAGLIHAQSSLDPKQARNFEQFIDAVFGEGIAKYFMRPYNFKVWAHPPRLMNKEWIGERVALVDIQRALKNVMLDLDDFGWGPNNQFKFPLRGGTGEFYRRFQGVLRGHVHFGSKVESIDFRNKMVQFSDGTSTHYDHLVSTMPLDRLCGTLLDVPGSIRDLAKSLRHSGGYMVGIGIEQPCPSTKSWMYFPEVNCPFYRVTYLSNYSPHMTPDNSRFYSLLCETSYSEFRPVDGSTIVDRTIDGLVASGMIADSDRKNICNTWLCNAPYSYPIPSVDRDQILGQVIPFLEEHEIYSRGRFGMWKYEVSNTDHSLMQGVELVNRLLMEEPEITIGMKYASTQDGRTAAVHERSARAGSGDPLKATQTGRRSMASQAGDKLTANLSEEELGVGAGEG